MNLSKLNIPFVPVVAEGRLILLKVEPYYTYENNKRTDKLAGYKYTVVEDKDFDKYVVKIQCATPAITQEQIDSTKQKMTVTFENASAKPYRTQSGDYELSITATGISIVK